MPYGAGIGSGGYGAGIGGSGYGAGRGARSGGYGAGYVAGATITAPTDITGLVGWWDFSDATSLFQLSNGTTAVSANNDPIGYATNKSAVAEHLVQSTAGSRPLYKTNIQNGRSVARWDGTDDFLEQVGAASYSQPNHIFIAFAKTTASASVIVFDGVTTRNAFLNNSGVSLFAGGVVATGQTFDTSFHQWSILFTGASSVSRLDQVAAGAVDPGAAALRNLLLGCDTGKASLFCAMDVGEVLVYNAALTGTNLSFVENYLKTRWATP